MSGDSYLNKESKTSEEAESFACPSCGGIMHFDAESQSMLCQYCSTKIDISSEHGTIKEYDITSAEENADFNWQSDKRVFKCDNCGAETILSANSTAQFCAFCGSSHIVKNQESLGIKPESVIPFKMSKDKAKEKFKEWVKRRFWAPSNLKKFNQLKKMIGIYIPYWSYDSDTSSVYRAERGTYYYVTRNKWVEENGQRKMVTERVRKIRWTWVSGSYSKYFDDVLINASRQVNGDIINRLEPFNLKELVHYKPEYLSGFAAERYSIGLKEGWNHAKFDVDNMIRNNVTRKIGGDEVRFLNISTSYNDVKFKHLLLPIWISSYTYKNKVYQFMINGQTGEVQGKSPISRLKITALIVGIIVVASILVYLFSTNTI